MIWLLFLAFAVLALAPLGWSLCAKRAPRGRHEADLALYAAQRAELVREKEAGRLDEAGHQAALVELQRRFLAVPGDEALKPEGRLVAVLFAALFLVPAGGFALYLWHGQPDIPDAPFVERQQVAQRDEALLKSLRERLAQLPPDSESARQGWILLGQAERARDNLDGAAEAWTRALTTRFDAGLAGQLVELQMQRGDNAAAATWLARALAETPQDPRLRYMSGLMEAQAGRVENARAVWRALLADAPADAPWRVMVERQLQGLQ